MNRAKTFWLESWQKGRIPFHRDTVDADLMVYVKNRPLPLTSSRILVPLCGKSVDLIWLLSQGFSVVGIELSELAIQQLQQEHDLPLKALQTSMGLCYQMPHLTLWVADFFTLPIQAIAPVDMIYDRAALIALPRLLRERYAKQCLAWLKPSGQILLKTLQYAEGAISGPPYSLSASEVQSLYGPMREATLLSEQQKELQVPQNEGGLGSIAVHDSVWCIE